MVASGDPLDVERAGAHYRGALVLANELGMRPLVAHCHLGLGKLYRQTGDRAKAQEHLTTATSDVPRDGHDLLAGEDRRGAGWSRTMTRVERRVFLAGTLALLAAPLAVEAQPAGKVWRIGYLSLAQADTARHGFQRGLADVGYVEGHSVRVEYRQAGGDAEIVAQLAVELVALKPDVLVTIGTVASRAAQRATRTIPIVSISGDPVGASLVASLARPGGNVTGIAITTGDAGLRAKQLELLKEAVPQVSRVAYIRNPSNPSTDPQRLPDEVAAPARGEGRHVRGTHGR